jgi:hypothetical protein
MRKGCAVLPAGVEPKDQAFTDRKPLVGPRLEGCRLTYWGRNEYQRKRYEPGELSHGDPPLADASTRHWRCYNETDRRAPGSKGVRRSEPRGKNEAWLKGRAPYKPDAQANASASHEIHSFARRACMTPAPLDAQFER